MFSKHLKLLAILSLFMGSALQASRHISDDEMQNFSKCVGYEKCRFACEVLKSHLGPEQSMPLREVSEYVASTQLAPSEKEVLSFLHIVHNNQRFLKNHGFTDDQLRAIKILSQVFKPSIEQLDLSNKKLKNIPYILGQLKYFTTVRLHGNQLEDVSALAGLINLRILTLNGNQLTDVSPLRYLINLRVLTLNGRQLTDVTPLRYLINMRILTLSGNQLTDVTPLRYLINLTELDLSNNKIKSVRPLKSLTELKLLRISGNPIRNLHHLKNLRNLIGRCGGSDSKKLIHIILEENPNLMDK